MKKSKGTVLGQNIKIRVEKTTDRVTNLDTTGINSSDEIGVVVGIGQNVTLPIKIGDRVVYKSWAMDQVMVDGEIHSYISEKTDAIKEII